MPKNYCDFCQYQATDKSNLNKHFKSRKHHDKVGANGTGSNETPMRLLLNNSKHSNLEPNCKDDPNKIKKYKCLLCDYATNKSANLTRHDKICSRKEMNEVKNELKNSKNRNKLIKTKLESSENEIKHCRQETDHYKKEAEYYKMMLNEAGKMMHKSVRALTYVAMHYKDAPGLTMIEPEKALNLITDKGESNDTAVMQTLLTRFECGTFVEYIGNLIVNIYKKKDPTEQSVWNSDSTRLTYLIKEIISENADLESYWKIDKRGHTVQKYLIEPLLKKIAQMLIDHQLLILKTKVEKHPEGNYDSDEEDIIDSHKATTGLIKKITKGSLSKKILKYISAELQYEVKK